MNTRKPAQARARTNCSRGLGGRIKKNPFPLMRDEKLETQKGIRKRRNVCQPAFPVWPGLETLKTRAAPMTMLMPMKLIQMRGEGSK